jgi:hypothetical protein
MDDENLAARKHFAANDPSFPARREQAWSLVLARLEALLIPRGYVLKGATFSLTSPQGRSAVHLQRSRYGWDVQIILRFLTPTGEPPDHPDWPGEEDITLAHFFDRPGADPGTLAFLDILEQPNRLNTAVQILQEQVLPWFDELHFPQD